MATLGEIVRWLLISAGRAYRRILNRLPRRRSKVVASDQRFRALIETAPDAMVIVNSHSHIELVNVQAERMFGYEAAELIGQNLTDLIPKRYRDRHRVHTKHFMSDAHTRPMGAGLELFALRKNGTEFPVEISLGPLETDRGLLVSCVVRDITPRMRIEAELRDRAAALERSNAELERFAYVASHDLSTPLRSIEGFTGLLQRRYHDKLGDDANEFIEMTQRAAARMRALIDDLLAYAKVSSAELTMADVDATAAVESAVAALSAEISASGAQVTYGELPIVRGDEGRLVQVFQNLIGNGIKFTREVPQVEITAEPAGDSMWRFSVRDHGIGIDTTDGDRIFEMFERQQAGEEFEGTGIGLALCKRIVEQHGGEIAAARAPDRGSILSFTLPAGAPEQGVSESTMS